MDNFKIEKSDNQSEASEIVKSLVQFNDSVAAQEKHKSFFISAKDNDGNLIGGVKGYTHWSWLFISHLWVTDEQKGKGVGNGLMIKAEKLGKRRGCDNAWVDTFSFQALSFYKNIGYEEFASLDDYPPGESRHFLRKKL